MSDPSTTRNLEMDDLGFEDVILEPFEIVEGAILVVRTAMMTDEGRQVRLVTATSSGMDFITKRGMVELLHDSVLDAEPGTV